MSLIRLYLDEDVNPLLADHLRVRGFDVLSTVELGRRGQTDEDQLRLAASEGRCLLTHNRADFLVLATKWAKEGIPHRGILLAHQGAFPMLLHRVLRVLSLYSAEDLENIVMWVP